MIQEARFAQPEPSTVVSVTMLDGMTWQTDAALPPDNEIRRHLADWRAGGGIISPYVAPQAPLLPITPRQLRMALLLEWGVFEEDVMALIAMIPDQFEQDLASIEWRCASVFQRNHPLVASIGAALGKSEAQINTAWRAAELL